MTGIHLLKVLLGVAVVGLFISVAPLGSISTAAAMDQSKTADGLTVHLGVVPAEIVKGSQPHSGQAMHGGIRKGMHEHHLVVAVFEAATGARVADATVRAQVSGDFQGLENWSSDEYVLEEIARRGIGCDFERHAVRCGVAFDAWGARYAIRSEQPLYYLVRRGSGRGTMAVRYGYAETARARYFEGMRKAGLPE